MASSKKTSLILWRLFTLLLFFLSPAVLVSCSGTNQEEAEAELDRNLAKWRSKNMTAYRYEFSWDCFCGPDLTKPVAILVQNGAIETVIDRDTGEPVEASHFTRYPTVEGLFDLIRDAIHRDAHRISITYHPENGYPESGEIDYEMNTIDEETGFTVREFTIRPPEIVSLFPVENAVIFFPHCPAGLACPAVLPPLSVSVQFTFPGEDTFDSARLFVDGRDVTPESEVISDPQRLEPAVEGSISYGNLWGLSLTPHEVSVEGRSNTGKTVSYRWTFELSGAVPFQTVAKGYLSRIEQPRFEAIRDDLSWNAFWIAHAAGTPPIPAPEIDFQNQMVILAHRGVKPTGAYDIAITRIEPAGGELAVLIDVTDPGQGCPTTPVLTQPFHIVKLPRSDREVSFVENPIAFDC